VVPPLDLIAGHFRASPSEEGLHTLIRQPAKLIALLAMVLAVVIFFWPVPEGADAKLMRAGAVVLAAVIIFATHSVPEHLVSLIFMLAVVVLGVAPATVAFSGFQTSAVWMLFGGIFISYAIRHVGLHDRMGRKASALTRLSYPGIITAVVFAAFGLGFIMPAAIGRIVVMMPIALAMADRLGFTEGRPGRTGIAMAVGMGTLLPASSMLATNLPNVVLAGSAEALYGMQLIYGEFILWHFPVTGFLKAAVLAAVLSVICHDKPTPPAKSGAPPDAVRREQKILIWVLAGTIILWSTDFLHRIAPGHVALGAALIILIPRLKLVPNGLFREGANLTPFFYVAGILSIGAVVAHTGIGDVIARVLIAWLDPTPGNTATNYATLFGISNLVTLVTTAPGMPVVMTPLAQDLAQATGLPLKTVLMIYAPAASNILLPFTAPPLVVALGLSDVSARKATAICLVMAFITIIILVPLNFLWWRVLDVI